MSSNFWRIARRSASVSSGSSLIISAALISESLAGNPTVVIRQTHLSTPLSSLRLCGENPLRPQKRWIRALAPTPAPALSPRFIARWTPGGSQLPLTEPGEEHGGDDEDVDEAAEHAANYWCGQRFHNFGASAHAPHDRQHGSTMRPATL